MCNHDLIFIFESDVMTITTSCQDNNTFLVYLIINYIMLITLIVYGVVE
jgi:hypothetical protein